MPDLSTATMFISGASRGIGLAIALRAARDGANVALIAKTAEPHPKLEGTIYTAAQAIEEAGGHGAADRRRHPRRGVGHRRRGRDGASASAGSTSASTTPARSTSPGIESAGA